MSRERTPWNMAGVSETPCTNEGVIFRIERKSSLSRILKEINHFDRDKFKLGTRSCFRVHPLLLEQNCYFNWVTFDDPLTIQEAETISSTLSKKFESVTSEQLRMSPVGLIAQQLTLAFFRLVLKKVEAEQDLKEAGTFIQKASEDNLLSFDYAKGFEYLLKGLEGFKKSLVLDPAKEDIDGFEDLKISLEQITPFPDLPPQSHVLIKGVHSFFAGHRKQNSEEIKLLQDVNAADPSYIEWPISLHRALRIFRKQNSYNYKPFKEEEEAILRALKLSKDNVFAQLHYCLYLGDVIRSGSWKPRNGRLVLEDIEDYEKISNAVNHIKCICKEILENEEGQRQPSVKIYLTIADIVGFLLPSKLQNRKTAKMCLDKALEMDPNSSRANHKMGMFLLTSEEHYEEALKYLKTAFEQNNENAPAFLDRIQLLLRKPEENCEELETLFEEQVAERWSPRWHSSLLFAKGIFYFMLGRKEEAVWTWIEGYKTDVQCVTQFKQIPHLTNRYKWNITTISTCGTYIYMDNIKNGSNQLKKHLSAEDIIIISKFLDYIKTK